MASPADDPSARWEQLAEHFGRLMDADEPGRAGLLAEFESRTPELAAELAAMLAATKPEAVLEIERQLLDRDSLAELPAGSHIGPYCVVRLLGRGGMGEVYLADRLGGTYQQQVAVKVLRAGIYGQAALARFDRERRILARLTHPAVVPLLDGGVCDDGRPYLVLQYAEGRPITTDADARRLGVRERILRVVAVCRAVQYAHAQLVVHRDLKPSNILVAEDGSIRLLDFGIARILDEERRDSDATRRGAGPMTPERAAPEELRGGAVTTAADVWGLGVLLYELLTGRLPFRGQDGSASPVTLAVADGRLTRPSQAADEGGPAVASRRGTTPARLRRALRGDLERIVHCALQHEPERRYSSVAALADDLDALLDGRPISARPDSWGYRTRRFVLRHRAASAASVVAVAALVGITVSAVVQSRRVAAERDRASAEQRRATAVVDLMAQVLGQTDPRNGRTLTTVSIDDLLTRAEAMVPTLATQPDVQGRMLQALGSIRFVRSERPAGLALLERALATTADLPLVHPVRVGLILDYADALVKSNRVGDARPLLAPVVEALRADPTRRTDLARALQALGLATEGESGLASIDEALTIDRAARPLDPVQVASDLDGRANLEFKLGRTDRARDAWREALPLLESARGAEHPTTMLVLGNLASVLDAPEEANERIRIFERLAAFNEMTFGEMSVQAATAWNNLGVALVRLRRFAEGERALRQAAERYDHTAGPAHPNAIGALRNVGRTLEFEERYEPALVVFGEIARRLEAADAPVPERAPALTAEAQVRLRMGDAARAVRMLTQLVAALEDAGRTDSVLAADAGVVLGRAWLEAGEPAAAVDALRESVRVRELLHPPLDPRRAEAAAELGRALIAAGDPEGGRRRVTDALPLLASWPLLHQADLALLRAATGEVAAAAP